MVRSAGTTRHARECAATARQQTTQPGPLPASSEYGRPTAAPGPECRTGPVSHIGWRTTVAHHPTEDTALTPCL